MAEKEYIERGAVLATYKKWLPQLVSKEDEGDRRGVETCIAVLEDAPAVDVVEVRHGEWVLEHEDYGKMMCSVCKKTPPTERKPDPYEDFQLTDFYIESTFCPNCGAKMDGGKNDDK